MPNDCQVFKTEFKLIFLVADMVCVPPPEDEEEFEAACKVPTHSGPLVEGWEVNHKWGQSKDPRRVHDQNLNNGDIDPAEFGGLTKFTKCLISAMKIIEGTSYNQEIYKEYDGRYGLKADVNKKPFEDNGTLEGLESTEDDKILAGAKIGHSNMHLATIRVKNNISLLHI